MKPAGDRPDVAYTLRRQVDPDVGVASDHVAFEPLGDDPFAVDGGAVPDEQVTAFVSTITDRILDRDLPEPHASVVDRPSRP